ncbi:MAG: hypothetical protein AAB254_10775, partial [candidate division NC10 bacterium]
QGHQPDMALLQEVDKLRPVPDGKHRLTSWIAFSDTGGDGTVALLGGQALEEPVVPQVNLPTSSCLS